MTKFVSHSDPVWAGKGGKCQRIVNLGNTLFGRVCMCTSLHSNTVHLCVGEETCGEEKKGAGGTEWEQERWPRPFPQGRGWEPVSDADSQGKQ